MERAKSVWWPLSKDIADAANRLGFGTLHEVNKAHPRDWENPGRVRVQWKKDGRLVNPDVMTSRFHMLSNLSTRLSNAWLLEKQLLEVICSQIQSAKAENIPQPPYNITTSRAPAMSIKPPATSNKGKQPMTARMKPPLPPKKCSGRKLPIPPEPHPPLASRVSPYSPAISTGVLIETVKAGMNATAESQGSGGGTGLQKGKRKVIRVRG